MESGSKSGGAAAAAGGRLLVDESSSDVQNDRKRFQIELKPGETTIVSWVKLLKESGIPVDQSPPPSPEPPKWFHEEDEPRREYSNIILKKEKEEQNYRSSTIEHCQPKKQRTDTSQVLERVNVVQLTKNTKMGHARSTSSRDIKDESCGLMNGSMLESTILEMETMVAESRQLHGDVQDSVHSVASKSHLPPELKKKLETVARLAHSSQGRISDELMMRLMSILGHWLKPRTLKRCLRDIVSSSTCGLDDIRFIQIKKEVVEMIKLRVPSMETKVAHNAKYSMDHEMEDKICDFYDIYVQAMDEIKNSEIRKFYIQLAALWPKGSMDNHGIRNAICRAKERRRTLLQEKGHEKKPTAGVDNNLHEEANLVAEQGKTVNDHNAPVVNFPDTVVPGTPELDRKLGAPAKRFSPPSAGDC
ncbi:ubinuclein-2 isoform X4 [Lactuca sativa]|uniref:ubinuclein-2 isoform X4 n=1 Tax=Lactuca sativa TaxID=4236 RepID=UPI001C68BE9F|nr:ubinuclein-2 isoform X4 [Lactuca sativa]